MRQRSDRIRRRFSALGLLQQLVGLGAGLVVAVTLATVMLAFGSSTSATLERVYEPANASVD